MNFLYVFFKKISKIFLVVSIYLMLIVKFIESETLQITTYYPAPYGAYASILTTQNTWLARDEGNVAIGSNFTDLTSPDGIKNGLLNVHDIWLRSVNKWLTQLPHEFLIIQTDYNDCNTYCCPKGYSFVAMGGITNGEKNLNSAIVNERCIWVREGSSCGQSGKIWLTCVR